MNCISSSSKKYYSHFVIPFNSALRNPKYTGAGIYIASWFAIGMGVNGSLIGMPVYHEGRALIGYNGKTDAAGNVVISLQT